MPELSRRSLIRRAAVVGAAAMATGAPNAALAAASKTAGKATATPTRFGDLRDIKHVMILMQENRSFDMYFGTLKGVIGYGDKATITLPGGDSVFQQPLTPPGEPITSTQYPFSLSHGSVTSTPLPPNAEQGAQNANGTDHSWPTQNGAWYGGLMNAWYFSKGIETLGYFTRDDIPFQYALADAYTVGDAYHCSVLSATGPNRTYLWSGTINADQENGSFIANNGGDELGRFLPWQCYSVTLQNAGLSWHIYQGSDNYGDNGAQYFATFADLDPSQGGTAPPPGTNVYYDNGLAVVPEPNPVESGNADNLALAIKNDVLNGTLPQVSWVVTNQQYSEHPDGAPTDGAYYVGQVLQALNADPDVFNSTLVIIDYDENDGAFDHVPPPVPPQGTTDEFVLETSVAPVPLPVGLGFRVPLFLISPWTRGGWVTSEVSDHTSVLQFLERWTTAIGKPAICPNISEWRRSVSGDLTNAFDFANPVYGLPDLPFVTAPVGEAFNYQVVPTTNRLPTQEPGVKPARPLPYQANVVLTGFSANSDGTLTANLALSNNGPHVTRSSVFAVYNNLAATPSVASYPGAFPGQYTVAGSRRPGTNSAATVNIGSPGPYDITVVSANRFLRRFTGNTSTAGAAAQVSVAYYQGGFGLAPTLFVNLANNGAADLTYTITHNQYSAEGPKSYRVRAGQQQRLVVDPLAHSSGWYDLTLTIDSDPAWSQRFTGHVENGKPSITGA
jgi:phospholipase C